MLEREYIIYRVVDLTMFMRHWYQKQTTNKIINY